MTKVKKILFLYCESSVHAGAGSSTGTIDSPIQREVHTNLPKIRSSSLRGAMREAAWDSFNDKNEQEFAKVFGYKTSGDIHSAIDIGDARLLFFPVRSWKGVFAWVTCPLALNKFAVQWELAHGRKVEFTNMCCPNDGEAIVDKNTKLTGTVGENKFLQLEEFQFKAKSVEKICIRINNGVEQDLGDWMSKKFNDNNNIVKMLKTNIAIVSDDVFRDFTELFTEKITRNKIDSATGTAADNALFNEEFLPPESILYAFVGANKEYKDGGLSSEEVMDFFENNLPEIFQGGGDKGIGKGVLRRSMDV